MGKFSNFGGALFFLIGILAFAGFILSGAVIKYIDTELEENCDSAIGQIGQITGIDEGKCEDGRNKRDMVIGLRTPLLVFGGLMTLSGGVLIFKN